MGETPEHTSPLYGNRTVTCVGDLGVDGEHLLRRHQGMRPGLLQTEGKNRASPKGPGQPVVHMAWLTTAQQEPVLRAGRASSSGSFGYCFKVSLFV